MKKKVVKKAKKLVRKPSTKSNRKVVVKLEFNANDLNRLLECTTFCQCEPRRVEDLTAKEFAAFRSELQETGGNFAEEILETSRDACANDWLCEWGPDCDGECYEA